MNQPKLLKWLLMVVPALAVVLGVFYFGKLYIADELIFAQTQVKALQTDLLTTSTRLDIARTRATVAEREADVVRRANALLRESERHRQDEISGLQADLTFYRRLGGANGSQAALAVRHMELQRTHAPRVYRLVFTLTQNLRWASSISGRVQLEVDGIQNGVAGRLDDKQLLAENAAPLKFQFKYFQQLERLITVPEGFAPDRLTIRLKSGSLSSAVEQTAQWQDLFVHTLTDNPVGQ